MENKLLSKREVTTYLDYNLKIQIFESNVRKTENRSPYHFGQSKCYIQEKRIELENSLNLV